MNCYVKSIINYEHQPNDFVVEHFHRCFECVYYLSGKGTISVEKETYTYDGPTLTVVGPGLLHDEKTDQKSKLFILLFDTDEPELFKPFTIIKISEEENEKLKVMFENMIEEEKNKKPFYQEMISHAFSLILCKYMRKLSGVKISTNKEMVERTKSYIKENYKQNIDFDRIARNVGYSYDRFRHIFKEETGVSIHQYLLNCRLYVAKQLLISSNMTVKEVAKASGFASEINFNNFFKTKMNITPYQFKKASLLPVDQGVFRFDQLSKKHVIIDTDIGGDCDDAGALALANHLHNSNKINILAITFTTSCKYGPACIDAINRYYGNSFPIGQTNRSNYCEFTHKFQEILAKEFPNDIYDHNTKTLKQVPNAVSLIRQKLADSNNDSVTIICIGQLNNVSDLLDSLPDEVSPLSGVELVRQKVKEFIVMGGMFPQDKKPIYFENRLYKREYNISSDIKSSRNFISKCPKKVYFIDFLCGYKVLTGQSLLEHKDEKNPVKRAYELFQNKPRPSWDPLTIWFACFGKSDFFKISNNGTINIDDTGKTTYNPNIKSGHYYLSITKDPNYIAKKIDILLVKKEEENEN